VRTVIRRVEAGLAEKLEDHGFEDNEIDGLSPEDWSRRQARRAFTFGLLTPVWWIASLVLINVLAEVFPSTTADSTFVFVTWGIFSLIFTATVIFTGVQHSRLIQEYQDRKGLWAARGAVIVGAIFTVVTLLIMVNIFTNASNRPVF